MLRILRRLFRVTFKLRMTTINSDMLYLTTHRRKLFQHGIQNKQPDQSYKPSDDEDRAFQRARIGLKDYLKSYVGNLTSQDAIEKLRKLRQKVLGIQFISVELENEDDAYVIFEVLNTRGKDLRVSHLLKNLITKYLKIGVKGADPSKDKWDKIVSQLDGLKGSYDIDSFLFHYWLAHESSVAKARLFKEYKENIKNKQQAKDYLDELYIAAPSYLRAVAPKDQPWEKEERALSKSLAALTVFRVAQALPLVLSILRLYYEGYIKLKQCAAAIKLIENFTFQFNAITGSRGGGGISNMYARLAQDAWECDNGADFTDVLSTMKEKFSERLPSLEEFTLPFSQIIYRKDYTRDKDLIRYTLEKLQRQLGWAPETDYDSMTVEHIINQFDGRRTEEADDCGAIGNLLLISEKLNLRLGTKGPTDKLKIMQAECKKLDEVLEGASKWTYGEVVARGGALAELGYTKIWSV